MEDTTRAGSERGTSGPRRDERLSSRPSLRFETNRETARRRPESSNYHDGARSIGCFVSGLFDAYAMRTSRRILS